MITPDQYQSIICSLDKADAVQQNILSELITMESNLAQINTTDDRKTSLLTEIDSVSNTVTAYRTNPIASISNLVSQLQKHIVKYYGSVDSFLSNNGILVSPYFANISSSAGYPIKTINIGTSCVS